MILSLYHNKKDMPRIYKVGGCVRDRLLEIESKDIDFTFVVDDINMSVEDGFASMYKYLSDEGFTIFLSTPDCFTIRAKFPSNHPNTGMVADFVLARKEVEYVPGTRRPILELGTLEDDLRRRDFTLNALAEDEDGNIIDLFNGIEDLKRGYLRTPLPCTDTFNDDPLRILRAIRFCITKGFWIGDYMNDTIRYYDYETKMTVVSIERIREELYKCFKHDTLKTLNTLHEYPALRNYIFESGALWLKPTMEKS
jgi:tRNA nucleotidyltransferase/poly(A) polymerase